MRRLHSLIWPLLMLTAALLPNSSHAGIEYILAISVDGLRGDLLKEFIETAPTEFPSFVRLRSMSAFTYNARCDYGCSITLPNHLTMLTGRPVMQPAGTLKPVHHGYTSDFYTTETIHTNGNPAVAYKMSIFDMAHDRGLSTALYLGKNRLGICARSWDATNGAPDTVGADNGRGKIDFVQIAESDTPALLASLLAHIAGPLERFTFFHIAETDYAGHDGGWVTTAGAYRTAVKTADAQLGQILDALQSNAALNGKVAILLTADHGGGGGGMLTSHLAPGFIENCTIPFFLVAPGFAGGSDLYGWFANRVAPDATVRPSYTAATQPIRNGDLANLAAALLGLPPVPGALMKPELKKSATVTRAGTPR
jgi:hypothetical protein